VSSLVGGQGQNEQVGSECRRGLNQLRLRTIASVGGCGAGYSRDDAWLGRGATRVDITGLDERNKKRKGFLSEDYLS
jgi:hypothetical protein